jgi:hypothetical protein
MTPLRFAEHDENVTKDSEIGLVVEIAPPFCPKQEANKLLNICRGTEERIAPPKRRGVRMRVNSQRSISTASVLNTWRFSDLKLWSTRDSEEWSCSAGERKSQKDVVEMRAGPLMSKNEWKKREKRERRTENDVQDERLRKGAGDSELAARDNSVRFSIHERSGERLVTLTH